MTLGKLLWVDDEIEMLRPHILFLNKKTTTSSQPRTVRTPSTYVGPKTSISSFSTRTCPA